jgi:seryl-tRNA synthetase
VSTAAPSPVTRVSVSLARPANDMVQEEITKRVHHLSKGIANVAFEEGGTRLLFDAPADHADDLAARAADAAQRVQRSLRNLARNVVYKSRPAESPAFKGDGSAEGVLFTGPGQVALRGLPLAVFDYFDRVFTAFGVPFAAAPLRTPTLIPVETLAKCDYLKSFPHIVNFVSHLPEDPDLVEDFQQRHKDRLSLDERAPGQMDTPEAALSPAVCYHCYALHANETIPAGGVTYGVCGKCFRYESSNMKDLRRLWDFTLREVVFMGTREEVLAKRERAVQMMSDFLEQHEVAAEIRTASDPFFVAPDDALAKTYFQLSSDTKYEVAAYLPDGSQLAVASLNYHSDFFGRVFNVDLAAGGAMQSVCVGFGLERWVHAWFAQHGNDPAAWPEPIRTSPEIRAALGA